jgi:hypothetical protein
MNAENAFAKLSAPAFKVEHFKLDRWGILDEQFDQSRCYLDLDKVRAVRSLVLYSITRLIGLRIFSVRYEKTKRGWHIVIHHNARLSPAETVALQCVLGSDRKREALNLMRALAIARGKYSRFWVRRFNILYRGKLP